MNQTQEMTTTSILSLFETSKEQRQSFALGVIDALEQGEVDPLKVHLQVKCMEDIIKLLNSNTIYKSAVLEAAEKHGQKSFEFMNSKVEIKEMGTRYEFEKCNDTEWELLDSTAKTSANNLKERETFLKTVPSKGLEIVDKVTGEMVTIYPPSKSSTTSVAITLK